jgi:hypothetical protein
VSGPLRIKSLSETSAPIPRIEPTTDRKATASAGKLGSPKNVVLCAYLQFTLETNGFQGEKSYQYTGTFLFFLLCGSMFCSREVSFFFLLGGSCEASGSVLFMF